MKSAAKNIKSIVRGKTDGLVKGTDYLKTLKRS
jgi:hypothetical protein